MKNVLKIYGAGSFVERKSDNSEVDEIFSRYFGCRIITDSFMRMYPDSDAVEHFQAVIEPFAGSMDGVTINAINLWNAAYGEKAFEGPELVIASFMACILESQGIENELYESSIKDFLNGDF